MKAPFSARRAWWIRGDASLGERMVLLSKPMVIKVNTDTIYGAILYIVKYK